MEFTLHGFEKQECKYKGVYSWQTSREDRKTKPKKKKYAQKISTFQNTTKAIRATGQLLSSIPKKITQGTYIEDTKKHQYNSTWNLIHQ